MSAVSELAAKHARVVRWLGERCADAALLRSPANIAWMACGGDVRRDDADAGVVVTAERCLFLLPANDADRLRQEELRGLGVEIVSLSTGSPAACVEAARDLLPAGTRWRTDRAGAGLECDGSVDLLRRTLLPDEVDRLRRLGRDAAQAVEEVAFECYRGILERDAAGRLAAECMRRQMTPRAVLAGADDRFARYPRPVPKGAPAERVLLLALVASRSGLHVALARTLCLVRPSSALLERFAAQAESAARLRHLARAGNDLGAVVEQALPVTARPLGGCGGIVGYAFPEVEAHPTVRAVLAPSQAVTWTLASPGVRCEDTDLVREVGSEMLTLSPEWPRRAVTIGGQTFEIPDLLLV